jgi:hypothetical protein
MQGQLFTPDFLTRGVLETPPWQLPDAAGYINFESTLRTIWRSAKLHQNRLGTLYSLHQELYIK